ncbi:hypothetical protein [Solirubrum puertoriconensis]|uniref:Uncharacterized protein n=1 Tax=Solirubrum puertoriconensis TaxID=1751427 RepID=A0A9X0HKN3_SOLP1|nr:hypothetical protein [Solirubrum puertoriconensis]KUG07638.1 hypothetical protein ASU33_15015 [Solirubrum puertoriconensis]
MAKKIRGLRRHYNRFVQLKQHPEHLPIERLYQHSYAHSQLGLHPWVGWSFASNPPTRFRQQAVLGLLNTFWNWQQQFEALPEPYYAAVWVTDLSFRDSQVVVGIRERIEWYTRLHSSAILPTPQLPAEYRNLAGVEQLQWAAYHEEIPLWPDELPVGILPDQYRKATTDLGEEYCLLRSGGTVWVGQLLSS